VYAVSTGQPDHLVGEVTLSADDDVIRASLDRAVHLLLT